MAFVQLAAAPFAEKLVHPDTVAALKSNARRVDPTLYKYPPLAPREPVVVKSVAPITKSALVAPPVELAEAAAFDHRSILKRA